MGRDNSIVSLITRDVIRLLDVNRTDSLLLHALDYRRVWVLSRKLNRHELPGDRTSTYLEGLGHGIPP